MMNRAFAIAALLAVGASGCASVNGWNQVQTKNFTVYTSTDEHYQETLRQLENAYASLSASFFKGKQIGNVEVLFLEDTDFINYFGNFRKGAALAFVPGDGKIGKQGLLILRPHVQTKNPSVTSDDRGIGSASGGLQNSTEVNASGAGVTKDVQSMNPAVTADGNVSTTAQAGAGAMGNPAGIAAKEMLTHLFIQRAMPKVPLWFHEGFAGYVSTSDVRSSNGKTFACFGFPFLVQGMIPVADMWDGTFDQYAKPEYRRWFQATGMTLVDYVIHADGNAHRGAMGPLVNGLAEGQPSAEVAKAAFGGASNEQIDNLLREHRQNISQVIASNAQVRGQCPFGVVIPQELAPDEAPPKITPVPPADIEALLRALTALPAKDEYPPYYPPEVLAKVKVPAKS